ncbi:hypothetical protein FJ970_13245 [Mesorhizobium sp. B2-1-8]|uniref:hypothetical protein n=1 Tax=unclassified Mesorhizobium TaxID=325217 RepID=UPI00112CD724|nr:MULTISPECIES: hypothetical protein [unclassified Mesorhizobium]TPI33075.1 hypothetical protein FJW08_07905 [Mesorhizobium sp. B3-2-1]UCI21855.1 hypothetical protein FJ970_13245 [Mesorhizobium sp. B2-1-8]
MGLGAGRADFIESGITPVAELAPADRDQMFALYETYYEAIDRDLFERDLSEKDAVVLVRRSRKIIGFSTYLVRHQAIGAETVHYLFSGDTVLHSSLWGNPVLLQGFFRAAGAAKAQVEGRLFWFSIIGGHRTFRILPNFFREFVPAVDAQDSSQLRTIRDTIAVARHGHSFEPSTGLIDFGSSQGHLREEWADVEDTAIRNRFAAFFLKANPFYFRGVELACLTELEIGNLKRYGATSFAEGVRDGR